jgi:hypothetical protein
MKNLLVFLSLFLLSSVVGVLHAQTIGSTKTEEFKADFEKKKDISAYLDYEGKNRMVQQFKASNAGISENKIEGRGKIKLAHYFVEIEVYDYSVSEDETINLKDGIKDNLVTRLGLQVRFTNAENGSIIAASGLGEAKTNRQLTLLSDATVDPIKFNQSTISISTKKALDIACANILDKMIKKGVFTK